MAAPFSWDTLLSYGPTLLNTAREAWERVKSWRRAARESAPALLESKVQQQDVLSLQQLTEAMAAQSELTKQLAEQANGLTQAISELSVRLSQVEAQTKQQVARMRAEVASQAARSRWAMTIAGLSIVLAGLLAALPYLSRYF